MNLVGVILIGGKNSRMGGQKKYFLKYQQDTFLQLGVELLSLFGPVYLSVAKGEKNDYINLPTIEDTFRDIGPMGGIFSCLKKLKQSILVLSCDMPLINYDTLITLVNHYDYKEISSFFDIEGNICAFPGIYTTDFISIFENQIYERNYRLRDSFYKSDHQIIDCKDSSVFLNINTPKDYMKL